MSGPKCYTPPPRYSAQVFDGLLRDIFTQQSRIRALMTELEGCRVEDRANGIRFDSEKFLRAVRPASEELLQPIVLDCPGTFDAAYRAQVERSLRAAARSLADFRTRLEQERHDFADRQEDHAAFLALAAHIERTREAFGSHQDRVCAYLDEYLTGPLAAIGEQAAADVRRVELTLTHPAFATGYRSRVEAERARIAEVVTEATAEIDRVRAAAADRCIAAVGEAPREPRRTRQANEVPGLVEQIRENTAAIASAETRRRLEDRLADLLVSDVLRGAYFYRELLEDVRAAQIAEDLRRQVQESLARALREPLHRQAAPMLAEVRDLAVSLQGRARLKPREVAALAARVRSFLAANAEFAEQEEVARREREFLRRQLVGGLERRGYEVLDDAEVIDFDARSEFALHVPGQDTVIGLRFREDGSFVYNFLIPEEPGELGPEATRQRLGEMERSCEVFRGVIESLGVLGVPIELTRERPADAAALIQAPEPIRKAVRKKRRRRGQTSEARLRTLSEPEA